MTEKTIIDGVDVSGCRYFTQEYMLDFSSCGHICKGTECKYKRLWYKRQLARKTAECEELETKYKQYIELDNFLKEYAKEIKTPSKIHKVFNYKQVLEAIKLLLKVTIEQTNIYPLKSNLIKILKQCEVLKNE